uniref:Uncharacterized protein n=1 Tax=Anguilla anguilla TaxID=7936 RepID=A0A0E9PI17_ANGAN
MRYTVYYVRMYKLTFTLHFSCLNVAFSRGVFFRKCPLY